MTSWAVIDVEDKVARDGLRVIGAGIRLGRLEAGMTQRQIAWRVGVSQSTISRLETGTIQGMRLATLSRIVGLIRIGSAYDFPDGPPPSMRRLPGERRT